MMLTLALVLSAGVGVSAARPSHGGDVCANHLCTEFKKGTPSCWKVKRLGYAHVSKCFIRRAARHYHQPVRDMIRVAHCESGWQWWLHGIHQGMYQYLWSTWRSTPYGHRSPYSPKWAALATGWMWRHGRRGEWQCQ